MATWRYGKKEFRFWNSIFLYFYKRKELLKKISEALSKFNKLKGSPLITIINKQEYYTFPLNCGFVLEQINSGNSIWNYNKMKIEELENFEQVITELLFSLEEEVLSEL